MSCTLKDVAQTAGVSTATVSRVINGADSVSDKTKSKVLSAISALKYSPDIHAVELRRGKGRAPRKRGLHRPLSVGSGNESHSNSIARAQHEMRKAEKAERLRLLEEENARLRRLVTNLSTAVETWKRVAQ